MIKLLGYFPGGISEIIQLHNLCIFLPLLLVVLFWLFARFRPEVLLRPFNYKEKFDELSAETGPRLLPEDREKLNRLQEKKAVALDFKATSERVIQFVYEQDSFNISGFNRALLIAFIYPILLLFLTWLFSEKGIALSQVEVLPPAPFYVKLLIFLLLIGAYVLPKFISLPDV